MNKEFNKNLAEIINKVNKLSEAVPAAAMAIAKNVKSADAGASVDDANFEAGKDGIKIGVKGAKAGGNVNMKENMFEKIYRISEAVPAAAMAIAKNVKSADAQAGVDDANFELGKDGIKLGVKGAKAGGNVQMKEYYTGPDRNGNPHFTGGEEEYESGDWKQYEEEPSFYDDDELDPTFVPECQRLAQELGLDFEKCLEIMTHATSAEDAAMQICDTYQLDTEEGVKVHEILELNVNDDIDHTDDPDMDGIEDDDVIFERGKYSNELKESTKIKEALMEDECPKCGGLLDMMGVKGTPGACTECGYETSDDMMGSGVICPDCGEEADDCMCEFEGEDEPDPRDIAQQERWKAAGLDDDSLDDMGNIVGPRDDETLGFNRDEDLDDYEDEQFEDEPEFYDDEEDYGEGEYDPYNEDLDEDDLE